MEKSEWEELIKQFDGYKSSVGGRRTDIEQLGYCLGYHVKESFSMNQIPETLVLALDLLVKKLIIASNCYENTVELIKKEFVKMKELETKEPKQLEEFMFSNFYPTPNAAIDKISLFRNFLNNQIEDYSQYETAVNIELSVCHEVMEMFSKIFPINKEKGET